MKNIKIAYQGMTGSNSDNASQEMSKKIDFNKICNNDVGSIDFIEGVTSQGVVDLLINNQADFGVVAIKNVLAGDVVETIDAFNTPNFNYEVLLEEKFPIHHCVFVKDKSCEGKINKIASHIHALLQCRDYISKFENVEEVELSDTAIGAKHLAEGLIQEDTAILCRRNAGEMFGLTLIAENIEDIKGNYTTFVFIKKIVNPIKLK
ncbi:MAG: prephenate dehydratase domain-containing protein [bacterium]